MRYLLHRFVIEGTVFKRYQSDYKKMRPCYEMGDLDGCISESPNYSLCNNRGLFFSNFSWLLYRRYPDNPTI